MNEPTRHPADGRHGQRPGRNAARRASRCGRGEPTMRVYSPIIQRFFTTPPTCFRRGNHELAHSGRVCHPFLHYRTRANECGGNAHRACWTHPDRFLPRRESRIGCPGHRCAPTREASTRHCSNSARAIGADSVHWDCGAAPVERWLRRTRCVKVTTILYILAGCMGLLGLGVLSAFALSRSVALLVGGLAYLCGGVLAIYYVSWWPLLLGFAAAWGARAVLGDPGAVR
jgi:hypothetical protein